MDIWALRLIDFVKVHKVTKEGIRYKIYDDKFPTAYNDFLESEGWELSAKSYWISPLNYQLPDFED